MSLSANKLFYTNTNYNDASNALINYNNLTGNSELLEHPLSKYARELFFSPNYNKEFFDSINWANSLGKYKNQNNLINPLANNVLVVDHPFHLSNAYKQMGANIGNATMPGQQVGNAIAISDDGKVFAVAAPGSYVGYLRVYKWNDEHPGTWDQMGSNSDTVPPGIWTYDGFGFTVAISGDGTTVVCGANSTQNPSGHQPPGPYGTNGYACVYKWNGSTKWDKVGGTLHGGMAREGFCGTQHSLALNYDGTILMAGASRRPTTRDNNYIGAVYVYELTNGQYTNIWTGLGTDFQHRLGQSIAMNATGSTFVTGGEGTWDSRGQANVYKREGNTNVWSKKATVYGTYLALHGQVDQFGWSAAMNADGTVFVIGGLGNIGNGSSSGYARVYEEGAGDTWDRRGDDFEGYGQGATLGMDVDINTDGTIILLGSTRHLTKSDGSPSYNHGEVHVYGWDGLLWNLVNNEIILGKENYSLGSRLAINGDGTIIAAGAPGAWHNGVWGTGYAFTFKAEPLGASPSPYRDHVYFGIAPTSIVPDTNNATGGWFCWTSWSIIDQNGNNILTGSSPQDIHNATIDNIDARIALDPLDVGYYASRPPAYNESGVLASYSCYSTEDNWRTLDHTPHGDGPGEGPFIIPMYYEHWDTLAQPLFYVKANSMQGPWSTTRMTSILSFKAMTGSYNEEPVPSGHIVSSAGPPDWVWSIRGSWTDHPSSDQDATAHNISIVLPV